jgi:hypothetical protein
MDSDLKKSMISAMSAYSVGSLLSSEGYGSDKVGHKEKKTSKRRAKNKQARKNRKKNR